MTNSRFNPKVDDYLANAADFARPVLTHLRALMHSTCPEIVEEIKWGIPHFDYQGDMMCVLAAAAKHCSFTFCKQEIMCDPRLVANPSLPAAKRYMGRLTSLADLPPDDLLVAYVQEAMALNENQIRPNSRVSERPKDVEIPPELAMALSADGKAQEIFNVKPRSFRRDYVIWITDARTEATRQKRVQEAVAWIAEGKGRFWKYERRN